MSSVRLKLERCLNVKTKFGRNCRKKNVVLKHDFEETFHMQESALKHRSSAP